MSELWPEWKRTATRGDLIRLAVRQRSVNVTLYGAIAAVIGGNKEKAIEKLEEASKADEGLSQLIDELGDEP